MENLQSQDSTPNILSVYPTASNVNLSASKSDRYEPLNYSQIAQDEVKKASRYKFVAYLAMGIGLAAFAAAIAVTAILLANNPITATAGAIIVFAVGAKLYQSVVKNKIFNHFKGLEAQSLRNAEIAMATHQVVQKLKLDPRCTNWTKREWDAAGKLSFCKNRSIQLQKESDALSRKVDICAKKLFDTTTAISPEAIKVLSNKMSLIRLEQHLKAEEALFFKVNAAYHHYYLSNPIESRDISEFLDFHTMSLRDADAHVAINQSLSRSKKSQLPPPELVTLKKVKNVGYSRDQVKAMKITELSSKVFQRQKAA